MNISTTSKIPFLYMLGALLIGILISHALPLPYWLIYISLICAILAHILKSKIEDIFYLFTIILIGQAINQTHTVHYNHNDTYNLKFECIKKLTNNNYIAETANTKYYLSSYHTDTTYNEGDILATKAKIRTLNVLSNPGEFNYNKYLQEQGVYYQIIPQDTIHKIGEHYSTASYFRRIRDRLLTKSSLLASNPTTNSIINSLCLGYKQETTQEFQNLFRDTGTIHLLSVSGLHTGAIYLMLSFILGLLGFRSSKSGLILLPLLWSYACLIGFPPSVVRAATILSFITIGKAFSKNYTPLNSLCAAAFFTLLFSPRLIFSVSFQMSYSAYAGIMLLYPKLLQIMPNYIERSYILSYTYSAISVTIAAQALTLPISAYYFHTININGFLANIVAVPLATIILYLSTLLLTIPLVVGKYAVLILDFFVKILVKFLEFFSKYSINLTDLYPSQPTILLIYITFISIILYTQNRKLNYLYITIIGLSVIFINSIYTNYKIVNSSELAIFHYNKQSAIILRHKGYYYNIYNNTTSPQRTISYVKQNKLQPITHQHNIYQLRDKELIFKLNYIKTANDSIYIANKQHQQYQQCNTLIITDNILPQKIFTNNQKHYPTQIILDASNNYHTHKVWKQYSTLHHIRLSNTRDRGFISHPL